MCAVNHTDRKRSRQKETPEIVNSYHSHKVKFVGTVSIALKILFQTICSPSLCEFLFVCSLCSDSHRQNRGLSTDYKCSQTSEYPEILPKSVQRTYPKQGHWATLHMLSFYGFLSALNTVTGRTIRQIWHQYAVMPTHSYLCLRHGENSPNKKEITRIMPLQAIVLCVLKLCLKNKHCHDCNTTHEKYTTCAKSKVFIQLCNSPDRLETVCTGFL